MITKRAQKLRTYGMLIIHNLIFYQYFVPMAHYL